MPIQIPRRAETLFGSRARAAILGYLAASRRARTGYSVAKALGLGVSKVYPELARLESARIVTSRPTERGSKGYVLADEDLRRFLTRQVPLMVSDEWFAPEQVAEREAAFEAAKGLPLPRITPVRKGERRPFAEEFRRPARKDRTVKRMKRVRGMRT